MGLCGPPPPTESQVSEPSGLVSSGPVPSPLLHTAAPAITLSIPIQGGWGDPSALDTLPRTYRPVYLVPFLSETIESAVVKWTTEFLPMVRSHGFSYRRYADDTQLYLSVPPDGRSVSDKMSKCLLDMDAGAAPPTFNLARTELRAPPCKDDCNEGKTTVSWNHSFIMIMNDRTGRKNQHD